MIESLRPMSLGELLDRTFLLYRRNFLLFVGIATLGPAAYLFFELLTIGPALASSKTPGGNLTALASVGLGLMVGIVIMLAGMAISQAATVKAVAAVHLGRTITVGGAYKALRGRFFRVLGVFLLVILLVGIGIGVIAVASALVGTLAVVGGSQAGTAGTIIGGLVGLAAVVAGAVLGITIYVRFSLSIQACVVEDLSPIASLKRSAVLSKGARSRVLAIYFIFTVLAIIVGGVFSAVSLGMGYLIKNPIISLIVVYLGSFIASSLTGPLATIGISLLYYDERVRKEAFDLQLMMATLDEPMTVAVPSQA